MLQMSRVGEVVPDVIWRHPSFQPIVGHQGFVVHSQSDQTMDSQEDIAPRKIAGEGLIDAEDI